MTEPSTTPVPPSGDLFGAIARFSDPAALVAAARRVREAGFRRIDAHSPFPIHGMDEALGLGRSKLPIIVLIGGIAGGTLGYALQAYLSAVAYPVIIGGKPLNSTEAWVPITFELTILFSAFASVFGMLALNGLPKLYHPTFRSDAFARATNDGFFLSIESADPRFDLRETPALLAEIGGTDVALLEA